MKCTSNPSNFGLTVSLFNIFPLHDARRRRRTHAKYSQLVPQLDDFIIPVPSECRGRLMLRGGLVRLSSSSSLLPPPIPLPSRPSSFFSSRSFFLHLYLPPLQRSANAARDDNERRNPAGISARDKRTLTAYEQASALMVPTLHRRPTGFLSLSPAPFHLFFHMLLPPIYLLLPLPPSVAYFSFSYRRITSSFICRLYLRIISISFYIYKKRERETENTF